MKFKSMLTVLFLIGAVMFLPTVATAQEGEPVVIDEVIAQVNDGVVTLSQLKREMKERVETLKQSGMSEQQAQAEVEKHKAELIATLINEELLLQKGKELDLSERVEAQVNKRMGREVADLRQRFAAVNQVSATNRNLDWTKGIAWPSGGNDFARIRGPRFIRLCPGGIENNHLSFAKTSRQRKLGIADADLVGFD